MADPNDPSEDDLARARRIGEPIARFMRRWRGYIAARPWLNVVYKVLITIIGVLVILAGIAMLVLPGPGWLTIFIGLAVLGSEYHWARRLTSWLRMQLARFWNWWKARKDRREQRRGEARGAPAPPPEPADPAEPKSPELDD